jgi:hypothetical protein
MAAQFMGIAIQDIAIEFQPQWGPIVRKLRIQKILPEWWVPRPPEVSRFLNGIALVDPENLRPGTNFSG